MTFQLISAMAVRCWADFGPIAYAYHVIAEGTRRNGFQALGTALPLRGCLFTVLLSGCERTALKGGKPLHTLRKEAGSIIATKAGIHAASQFLRHAWTSR